MKPSPISEEQEWQLFELLEGNLSPIEAANLRKQIQGDANLEAHYKAMSHTYLTPADIHFTEKESLKKRQSKRTVYFYTSLSAAATIAILWFFSANRAIQPVVPAQLQLTTTESQRPPTTSKPSNPSTLVVTTEAESKKNAKVVVFTTSEQNPTTTLDNSQTVHPLITATEPIRKVRNINDTVVRKTVSPQSTASALASIDRPSPKIAQQKTKKELLKSFYLDARRMIENGHVPHINVKTVNNDEDWMPEFQVGLTLENNVILTSFNPE